MDAYTGQDTLIMEDFDGKLVLTDFADGVVAELSTPNDLSTTTTGYNGNSLGAHNEPGRQRDLQIRLVKGSGNDKRFNKNYKLWRDRDLRFKPLEMSFTKRIAHGDGSLTENTVKCWFGLPTQQPTEQVDTTGNTDQVVSVYTIRFGNSDRTM